MDKGKTIAWTIAASDSSAGAGIQADLAAFAHFGVHGSSIITKITAQNSNKIISSYNLSGYIFNKQLEALKNDFPASAIKISVLGDIDQLNILNQFLFNYNGSIVYDPVINSTTGTLFIDNKLLTAIKTQLFPLLDLITPNIPEAEILTGIKINTYNDMILSAKILLSMGIKNVLLKGGHLAGNYSPDLLINNSYQLWLISNKLDNLEVHGTGCHLSSAIAANLALGNSLTDTFVIAKRYINCAIRNSYFPHKSSQQRYISVANSVYSPQDMPMIWKDHSNFELPKQSNCFPSCGELGLYPIVENSKWVEKLAKYGVTTIQLRIKNKTNLIIEQEIIKSIKIAQQYGLKLFINDYWQLAIKHRAYGIHLGQEDLVNVNLNLIKTNKLCLGISTHNHYELANAIAINPSYIALGPIFPTTTKVMPWQPQGLKRITEWQQMINCQLVVIGGICLENIDQIIQVGAKNIAIISAITKASDPKQITQLMLQKMATYG